MRTFQEFHPLQEPSQTLDIQSGLWVHAERDM